MYVQRYRFCSHDYPSRKLLLYFTKHHTPLPPDLLCFKLGWCVCNLTIVFPRLSTRVTTIVTNSVCSLYCAWFLAPKREDTCIVHNSSRQPAKNMHFSTSAEILGTNIQKNIQKAWIFQSSLQPPKTSKILE